MKLLGLIPARGLSDRVPFKNLVDLGGRPLIEWTFEAARSSGIFHRIAVSTEDSRIAAVARHAGIEVIDRPAELATSTAGSMPVVDHALEHIECDAVMLLQPTSPFRTAGDIGAAWECACRAAADSVVSVIEGPRDFAFDIGHAGRLRPKPIMVANGAIFALTVEARGRREDWYSGIAYAYRMPVERSIDIDTLADLERARACLVARQAA